MNSLGAKLWRLEAVRGGAAFYVFLHHLFHGRSFLLSLGQEAVIIFFVLSGFVIEYSSKKYLHEGFAKYFTKRALRIYPIFFLMLMFVAWVTGGSDKLSIANWRQVLGNLLMLQDLGGLKPNVVVEPLFSSALWSLHYEWWFYMIYFPISRFISSHLQARLIGVVGTLSAALYFYYPQWWLRLLVYFPIWWMGVVLARSYVETGRARASDLKLPLICLGATMLLLLARVANEIAHGGSLAFGVHPFLEVRHVGAAVVAVWLALFWQKLKWVGFRWLVGWGCWIAPVSYSLYIAHQPLLINALYLDGCGSKPVVMMGYCAILIAFCSIAELWLYPLLRAITSAQERRL